MFTTTENTIGTAEIAGKTVNINYSNPKGELPTDINASYHDQETQLNVSVSINVESGKVNFNSSNVTAVTTTSDLIQAIKLYLEGLVNELTA